MSGATIFQTPCWLFDLRTASSCEASERRRWRSGKRRRVAGERKGGMNERRGEREERLKDRRGERGGEQGRGGRR
eukprot:754644-Hanusia_phi.AAC.1